MRKKTVQFNEKKHIKVASANGCKLSKIVVPICFVLFGVSCTNSRHEHSKLPIPSQAAEKVKED